MNTTSQNLYQSPVSQHKSSYIFMYMCIYICLHVFIPQFVEAVLPNIGIPKANQILLQLSRRLYLQMTQFSSVPCQNLLSMISFIMQKSNSYKHSSINRHFHKWCLLWEEWKSQTRINAFCLMQTSLILNNDTSSEQWFNLVVLQKFR